MTSAAPRTIDGRTERLDLYRPTADDVDAIFAICSDWEMWRYYPSKRHTERAQSARYVARWMTGWSTNRLDTWVVRGRDAQSVLGYGGCSLKAGGLWNLGYRIAASAQGHGHATELSKKAVRRAHEKNPDLPVIASLLAHNTASEAVARKLGMDLVHRAVDTGNPDSSAERLTYADRPPLRLNWQL